MNSTQFAWLYLLKNGSTGDHSYYGGKDHKTLELNRLGKLMGWKTDGKGNYRPPIEGYMAFFEQVDAAFRHELKTVGVDWSKTKAPHSDSVSVFNGTFNDPGSKETLRGVLVLKNGAQQVWTADAEFDNVFEMMAQAFDGPRQFFEQFGEVPN